MKKTFLMILLSVSTCLFAQEKTDKLASSEIYSFSFSTETIGGGYTRTQDAQKLTAQSMLASKLLNKNVSAVLADSGSMDEVITLLKDQVSGDYYVMREDTDKFFASIGSSLGLKNTNTSTLEDEIHEELTSDYIMEEWMGITSGTTNYSGTTFPIAYEGTPDGGSPVFIFSLAKVTINGRSTSVLLEKKLGLPYELFSIGKKYSIIVKLNSDGKIDNLDDVTMGHGYKGTEKVTKISDDGKGFTFTTATGSEYIVSNLDATGVAGYQTTKVASTEITTTTTNDKDTTELFSPNKTHSIKVKLDNAGKIVSAALAQDYKETDKFKKISADGKSFTFTNAAGVEYTITPVLANSTYNTVKN